MPRQILVQGDKTFRITVPDDAKITYGPFSPPTKGSPYGGDRSIGTLRVYLGTEKNIIACFTGVAGFRDLSLDYAEQVTKEEGATIWNSDKDGYKREEKVTRSKDWVLETATLPAPNPKAKKKGPRNEF